MILDLCFAIGESHDFKKLGLISLVCLKRCKFFREKPQTLWPVFSLSILLYGPNGQQRSRKSKVQSTSHLEKKLSVLEPTQCLETNALKPVLPNREVKHQISKKSLENDGVPGFLKPTLDLSTLMSNIWRDRISYTLKTNLFFFLI